MFSGASNLAAGVDKAFIFIFGVAFLFIVGITVFMIYIVIKYNRKKNKDAMQFTGSTKLEIIWTVIPLIIVLIMFWYGWKGFAPMRKVPEGAMEVTAIGRMWEWEFDYGNGKISKDSLVLPVNIPVKLNLVSEDVNHSLFIPAFRVKEDVVPGYNNYLWFTPTYIGNYDVLCTEYCGLMHYDMLGQAKIVSQEAFENWIANLTITDKNAVPEGLNVLKKNGCIACHTLDGSRLVGPSFKGLYGKKQVVITDDGEKTVVADDAYLKDAIYEPNKEVVQGFNKGLMQSYKDLISEEEIDQINEYLKSISE